MQGGIDTKSLEEILKQEELEERGIIEKKNETCKTPKKRKISLKYKLCDLLPGIPERRVLLYEFYTEVQNGHFYSTNEDSL